jgi:hypothetical protein
LTSPPELRDGLRHLSAGLVAYGAIGLLVAAIGFGAVIRVNERVDAIREQVDATLTQEAAVIGVAAEVLHDAASTAQSLTVTVAQASLAVDSAAGTITELRSGLVALEDQLRSVNILGTTPLATSAEAVGRIVASIAGLDIRLSLIADGLEGNRIALTENATSLEQLADTTEDLAAQRRSDDRGETLGELQQLTSMTLLLFTAWSAVPALGAIGLGLWMRRTFGDEEPPSG